MGKPVGECESGEWCGEVGREGWGTRRLWGLVGGGGGYVCACDLGVEWVGRRLFMGYGANGCVLCNEMCVGLSRDCRCFRRGCMPVTLFA